MTRSLDAIAADLLATNAQIRQLRARLDELLEEYDKAVEHAVVNHPTTRDGGEVQDG